MHPRGILQSTAISNMQNNWERDKTYRGTVAPLLYGSQTRSNSDGEMALFSHLLQMSYDFVSNGSSGFNLKKSLNLEHMSGIQIEAYWGEMKCKQFLLFLLNMLGILLNLPNRSFITGVSWKQCIWICILLYMQSNIRWVFFVFFDIIYLLNISHNDIYYVWSTCNCLSNCMLVANYALCA